MSVLGVLVLLPLLGAGFAFLLPHHARLLGMLVALGLSAATLLLATLVRDQGVVVMAAGGWLPPLGIRLYADGLSAFMLCLTALVGLVCSAYSLGYFHAAGEASQGTRDAGWWPLWLLLWAALNALFLSGDAFNLYVTLELMGLVAVGLVALEASAVAAAIRYLLVGLTGSMFYLLGVGLLYAQYGTVDLQGLAGLMEPQPASRLALVLMSGGLLLKAALFPLHFWLPPAHAQAPAPVSAVLSALVVKAAFYILLRLWFGPFAGLTPGLFAQLLGVLGAGAIIWGSLQALLAARLKLVIAYSTVAQIGYLFLVFPLAASVDVATVAWYGCVWLAVSHGLAKAGLFLAAGNILHACGHDRMRDMTGIGQSLPVTLFAVGLAAVSLMGLPPSGGFMGKWLLLNAAFVSGQWWWAVVMLLGGALAAAYLFRVLMQAFRNREREERVHPPAAAMEWGALSLSAGAILIGLFSAVPLKLLEVGAGVGPLSLQVAVP